MPSAPIGMKNMHVLAWVCFGIYTLSAAAMYIPNRNLAGDQGVGLIIPLMPAPAILVAVAIVESAQDRDCKSAVAAIRSPNRAKLMARVAANPRVDCSVRDNARLTLPRIALPGAAKFNIGGTPSACLRALVKAAPP